MRKSERGTRRKMDTTVIISDRMPERAPSQQACFSDWDGGKASLRSQESFRLKIIRRHGILDGAEIHVHASPPPWDIRVQMNDIFEREISEKRRKEITDIANRTCLHLADIRCDFHEQGDLIEVVYEALRMMQHDDVFGFMRKAGLKTSLGFKVYIRRCVLIFIIDCEQSHKIVVRQNEWNLDAPNQSNDDVDDAVDGLSKAQLRESSFPSSNTSQSIITPPVAVSQLQQDAIKSPRPGFIIGFGLSTVSDALLKRGLSKIQADDVLKGSQRVQKFYSNPTQNKLDVLYPTLVIEGGENPSEVYVQAAVSGACLVNLRLHLINQHARLFPTLQNGTTPFIPAFSICTSYDLIELWVHYTLMKDNVRYHYANVFKFCSGSFSDELETFLLDVDRVMQWTKEDVLNEFADQLYGYDLAKKAARG